MSLTTWDLCLSYTNTLWAHWWEGVGLRCPQDAADVAVVLVRLEGWRWVFGEGAWHPVYVYVHGTTFFFHNFRWSLDHLTNHDISTAFTVETWPKFNSCVPQNHQSWPSHLPAKSTIWGYRSPATSNRHEVVCRHNSSLKRSDTGKCGPENLGPWYQIFSGNWSPWKCPWDIGPGNSWCMSWFVNNWVF